MAPCLVLPFSCACLPLTYLSAFFWTSSTYCAAQLVPIGYGIRKMQITAVIEDAKVSCHSHIPSQRYEISKQDSIFGSILSCQSLWSLQLPERKILPALERLRLTANIVQVESMDAIIEEELVKDGESESKPTTWLLSGLTISIYLIWPRTKLYCSKNKEHWWKLHLNLHINCISHCVLTPVYCQSNISKLAHL